jgi:hypothetical protein
MNNKYIKYPRTTHFPWSRTITDDDIVDEQLSVFDNEIVMTIKMDGENTTMYSDYIHARSLDSRAHWTQSWVRQLHASIQSEIPTGWRLCGENVFAQHSIIYENLESYFYLFSIWNEKNECLSWDDTLEWASLLNLSVVPVIYRGIWEKSPELIHSSLWLGKFDETTNEGYVIRSASSFPYEKFSENTGKYVRKNHVTSSSHWKFEKIKQNKLK